MTINAISRRRALALGVATLALATLAPRTALAALSRLHLLIGQSPGSDSDTLDRVLASLLQTDSGSLPVDIENVSGSSGRLAFKMLREGAGNPALVGFLQNGLLYSLLTEEDDSLAQFNTLNLLGSLGIEERALFVAKATGITDIAGLVAFPQPLIVPTVNATSSATLDAAIINTLTGSRLRAIPGYSASERKLALISGEANAIIGSIDSFGDLVEQGMLIPILRLSDNGSEASLAGLPLFSAIATGPDAAVLAGLIEAAAGTQQVVAAPPGLAESDIAVLAEIFDAAATRLAAQPAIGYSPTDMVWYNRGAVAGRVGALLAKPGVAEALRRAIVCGQALGEGGTCS
jgi:tripartite-type tricarboxylate transporter receptor subunit TctC